MATEAPVQEYLVATILELFRAADMIKSDDEQQILKAARSDDEPFLTADRVVEAFAIVMHKFDIPLEPDEYSVDYAELYIRKEHVTDAPWPDRIVINLKLKNAKEAEAFNERIRRLIGEDQPFQAIGINPGINVGDLLTQQPSEGALCGTLADAARLIGADQFRDVLNGEQVNVVIVDSGFDSACVPAAQFGGGWRPRTTDPLLPTPAPPGMTVGPAGLHGAMIAKTVLAFASKAVVFDVPLIPPPKIGRIPTFLAGAEATFLWISAADSRGEQNVSGAVDHCKCLGDL